MAFPTHTIEPAHPNPYREMDGIEVVDVEFPLMATADSGTPAVTTLFPSDVDLYRMLRYELPTAELKLQHRIQALIEADPETMKLQLEVERSRESIRAFEDKVADVFSADDREIYGPIRLETGGVLITWARPAEYFTMKKPLREIFEHEPTLAQLLGVERATKSPARPTIKIK